MPSLEDRTVDLVLTDPPYAISRETGFQNVKNGVDRFAISMDFGKWDHQPIDLLGFCQQTYRVLRTGGTAIIWYDIWKLTDLAQALGQAGFSMLRLIVWQKQNPVPLNQHSTYLSNCREIAVCAVRGGKPTFNSSYDPGVYNAPIPHHRDGHIHPTQKPVDLFGELVLKHSSEGNLVVDPFLGSGTTAEACLTHNRRFAGCDIDEGYVAASRRRLDRVMKHYGLQTSLFEGIK